MTLQKGDTRRSHPPSLAKKKRDDSKTGLSPRPTPIGGVLIWDLNDDDKLKSAISPSQSSLPSSSILPPRPPPSTAPTSAITSLAGSILITSSTSSSSTKSATPFPSQLLPPLPELSSESWTSWKTSTEIEIESESTATVFTTKTTSISSQSRDQPTLLPQATNLPSVNKAGRTSEQTAVKAIVIIICCFFVLAILSILFRFCPPIRNRWLAFKARMEQERLKRLHMDDLPPTIVVTATPPIARTGSEGWISAGPRLVVPTAAARRLGMNSDTERGEGGARGRRPPSYRTHFTASGASWVANGFRPPRRSEASSVRRWFGVSDGANRFSSDTESRVSDAGHSEWTSLAARTSLMSSGSQRASRGRGLDEVAEEGLRDSYASTEDSRAVSDPRTRRTTQVTTVSRMSSRWSEQRSSAAWRPSLLSQIPIVPPK